MAKILRILKGYLVDPREATEKVRDLVIELNQRGLKFQVTVQEEDGEQIIVVESVDYPHGHIITSGRTKEEAEKMLKDAIFTAFEIPAPYCNPSLIKLDGFFAKEGFVHAVA